MSLEELHSRGLQISSWNGGYILLQGIILTKFDYKLGPVAEYTYPQNFLDQATLFDLSFRIWTGAGLLNLSEAKGFTYLTFEQINAFGLTIFDKTQKYGNFGITCLFTKGDSSIIVPNLEKFKGILQKHNEELKDGQPVETVFESLFTAMSNALKEITSEKTKAKTDADTIKNEFYILLSELYELKKTLNDTSYNTPLTKEQILSRITKVIESAIILGDKLFGPDFVARLLAQISI